MPHASQGFLDQAQALKEDMASFLLDLVRAKSTVMEEIRAQEIALARLEDMGLSPWLSPIQESLKQDPEYSFADQDLVYDGRRGNVLCRIPGRGGGRSLILQSHLDVVPAEPDWPEAFAPSRRGDWVSGRGASDAKGQVACIALCIQILKALRIELCGDLTIQWVIEEEVGGNGALAAIREGHRADGVVVLEPSDLQIHPANRGAIWYRIAFAGKSVHMGRIAEGVSAIDKAIEAIRLLRAYEKRLLFESQNVPLFERYDRPVQLNVGTIHGGLIPSMVPGSCVIEGGVGFLPNTSMSKVKEDIRAALLSSEDAWLREHFALDFPKLHNDSYQTDPKHDLVRSFHRASGEIGLGSEVFGWNVSCDARLYSRLAGLPTVVFGPGSISKAHSREEGIDLDEICRASACLALFVSQWCGTERSGK